MTPKMKKEFGIDDFSRSKLPGVKFFCLIKGRPDGCTPNVRVLPWYLLGSLGILGDNLPINTHYIGLISGFSHRGTLVRVHPTIP